ncbi:MAG: hypothetical protein ACJ746_22475 [Bryobacteraceae bacterium]
MKKHVCVAVIWLLATVSAMPAEDNAKAGKKAEQQSCLPCHSLRLIDSQRLSAATWQKEVDKMIGWGAVVPDRQLLIDYLSQHYSNTTPMPAPVLSDNGK